MVTNRQLLLNKLAANGIETSSTEFDAYLKEFNKFEKSLSARQEELLKDENLFKKFLDQWKTKTQN
jgi:hypothetical protein